jgi:hypothetical protein
MRKEIKRYRCTGDSGRGYNVIERRNFTRFQPLRGPAQDVPGTQDWILSDGRHVNFIDDNTFQILDTDEFVRKIG